MKYNTTNINKIANKFVNDRGVLNAISVESIQNYIAPKFLVKEIFVGFGHSMLVLIDKSTNEIVNYKFRYTRYLATLSCNQKITEVL